MQLGYQQCMNAKIYQFPDYAVKDVQAARLGREPTALLDAQVARLHPQRELSPHTSLVEVPKTAQHVSERLGSPTARWLEAQQESQDIFGFYGLTAEELRGYEAGLLLPEKYPRIERIMDENAEVKKLSALLHKAEWIDAAHIMACAAEQLSPGLPTRSHRAHAAYQLGIFCTKELAMPLEKMEAMLRRQKNAVTDILAGPDRGSMAR